MSSQSPRFSRHPEERAELHAAHRVERDSVPPSAGLEVHSGDGSQTDPQAALQTDPQAALQTDPRAVERDRRDTAGDTAGDTVAIDALDGHGSLRHENWQCWVLDTLDWYRVARPGQLWRAFLPGLVLLPLGSILVALGNASLASTATAQFCLLVAGVLVTAVGPLWTLRSLRRVLGEDTYLALRRDGLALRLDPERPTLLVPWDEIMDAHHHRESDDVWLELRDGRRVRLGARFDGIDSRQLARRISEIRLKAVWSLLPPPEF